MIVGIGTDLCRISRMEKALASPAFFHRVFGPEEQALLERRTGAGRLATAAANFAAKEAFLKAAGVGLGRLFAGRHSGAAAGERGPFLPSERHRRRLCPEAHPAPDPEP